MSHQPPYIQYSHGLTQQKDKGNKCYDRTIKHTQFLQTRNNSKISTCIISAVMEKGSWDTNVYHTKKKSIIHHPRCFNPYNIIHKPTIRTQTHISCNEKYVMGNKVRKVKELEYLLHNDCKYKQVIS